MACIDEILNDSTSGSTELAVRIFHFFAESGLTIGELRKASERINSRFTGMALIRNVTSLSLKMAEDHSFYDIPAIIERQNEAVAGIAAEHIKERKIVTISNSSMVYDALVSMRDLEEVTVLESRPRNEGSIMASRLRDRGIRVRITTDASMCIAVRSCGTVIIGSDSILSDGTVINKTGSMPLALCSSYSGKKFIVLSTEMKIEKNYSPGNYPELVSHDPGEISGDLDAINYYFEMVPPDLVSEYILNSGIKKGWK